VHVLHISADYPNTTLYEDLLHAFENLRGARHTMYVPVRQSREHLITKAPPGKHTNVIYGKDCPIWLRIAYHLKRKMIYADLKRRVCLQSIDCIHAHYAFAGGGVAYEAWKEFRIPFFISVRNSDLNVFWRFAVHLRAFGSVLMQNSSGVIFLSPAYRDVVKRRYVGDARRADVEKKMQVIPNGLAPYWFQNRVATPRRRIGNELKILYVGEFTRNKNLRTLVEAGRLLRKQGYSVIMKFVGSGECWNDMQRLAEQNRGWLSIQGWIREKETLLAAYRSAHVFAMVSLTETFGLVYLEAMSQGLPVLYTKGQGFDGHFMPGEVGYPCDPDPRDVARNLARISCEYDEISARCISSIDRFSWDNVAKTLERLYNTAVPMPTGWGGNNPGL